MKRLAIGVLLALTLALASGIAYVWSKGQFPQLTDEKITVSGGIIHIGEWWMGAEDRDWEINVLWKENGEWKHSYVYLDPDGVDWGRKPTFDEGDNVTFDCVLGYYWPCDKVADRLVPIARDWEVLGHIETEEWENLVASYWGNFYNPDLKSAEHQGLACWIDNIVDNVWWQTVQHVCLWVRNDNYGDNVNLRWDISEIIDGPFPSSNWGPAGKTEWWDDRKGNEWVGVAYWDSASQAWVQALGGGGHLADINDLDIGESALYRFTFIFQNQIRYDASPWFPGCVRVLMKLYNRDNGEIYWTPELSWWVWKD